MGNFMKRAALVLTCACVLCGAFFFPTAADATEILYDDDFDLIGKLGETSGCGVSQGMAVGEEYLYCAQTDGKDTLAIINRIDIETGEKELMYNGKTGEGYFTNLLHANGMDWMRVGDKEYLCVIASSSLLLFEIDGTDLYPYARYSLLYGSGSYSSAAIAVESVSGNRVTYLFKNGSTISYAKISITATKGNVTIMPKCTLDVSKVTVDGKTRNFSSFVTQGMGYKDGYLFLPLSGNDDEATLNHNVVIAYDISKAKGSVTVQPDESKSFYVISEEYPALFELEDCGIGADGKLYFNTNGRRAENDTKHDATFVINNFVLKKEAAQPTYTVKYNAGGGTGSMQSATVETSTPITPAANAFKRDGYTFTGWVAYSALKKQNVKIGDTAAEGDTITFTAQWEKKAPTTYTVQYNANGGKGTMASVTVAVGTPLADAKNTFTREGYTFTGWAPYNNTHKKNMKIGDIPAGGDTVIMYAQWAKNAPTTYTVKYNAGGGTGNMPAVSVSVQDALKAADNAFTREGYTFSGWVITSAQSGAEVKIGDKITGGDTITFTAQWEKVIPTTYTVIYDGNGAEGTMESVTVGADAPLTPAENAFTREGYTFTGWVATSVLSGEEVQIGDTVTAGDTITLTAQWSQDTYTVVYNGNGADGEMESQTVPTSTAFAPARNKFRREGYAFLGWTAHSTMRGAEVAEGDTIAAGDTVTLTAQWGMYGDVNGDGKVNIADALAIRLYDWGYYRIPMERLPLMDMNADGVVNTADAHILFAILCGAVDMPVCE